MKRFFALCGGGLLAVLLLAVAVRAEEIKNQYFTLDLPSGWNVELSEENAEVTLLIVSDASRKNLANITISKLPEPMSAKEVCMMTCDGLKDAGVKVGEPVAAGESYVAEFSQREAHGFQYFTANGTLASGVVHRRWRQGTAAKALQAGRSQAVPGLLRGRADTTSLTISARKRIRQASSLA